MTHTPAHDTHPDHDDQTPEHHDHPQQPGTPREPVRPYAFVRGFPYLIRRTRDWLIADNLTDTHLHLHWLNQQHQTWTEYHGPRLNEAKKQLRDAQRDHAEVPTAEFAAQVSAARERLAQIKAEQFEPLTCSDDDLAHTRARISRQRCIRVLVFTIGGVATAWKASLLGEAIIAAGVLVVMAAAWKGYHPVRRTPPLPTLADGLDPALIEATRPGADSQEQDEGKDQDVPRTQLPARTPSHEEVRALVHDLVESMDTGSGVLLTRISRQLRFEYPGQPWKTADVRNLLTQAAIPIREGVRTPDGNGPGVHRDDAPAAPSDTPAPPPSQTPVDVVGTGQDANNNTNRPIAIGEGVAVRQDAINPQRWDVVELRSAADRTPPP